MEDLGAKKFFLALQSSYLDLLSLPAMLWVYTSETLRTKKLASQHPHKKLYISPQMCMTQPQQTLWRMFGLSIVDAVLNVEK